MPVEVNISEEKLIVRRLQPMIHNQHKSLQSALYAIGIKNGNQYMSGGPTHILLIWPWTHSDQGFYYTRNTHYSSKQSDRRYCILAGFDRSSGYDSDKVISQASKQGIDELFLQVKMEETTTLRLRFLRA